MKAEETIIVLLSLLGTISQAAKLLKVPRIYNAIITSDKELLPSQAFPALSPVFHSIHFPHFANALYPIANSGLYNNEAKTIDKTTQYYDTYAKGVTGPPLKNNFPDITNTQKLSPPLFMPNFKPKGDEDMPNIIPNSNLNNRPDMMKQFYPHYDNEIGQIFNVMNYENKKVYSASSPVSTDYSPSNQAVRPTGNPFIFPLNKVTPGTQTTSPPVYQYPSYPQNVPSANENNSNENNPSYTNPSSEPDVNQYPLNYNFIKNNRPKDDGIVDVPPPPLPVGNTNPQRRNVAINVNPSQLGFSS